MDGSGQTTIKMIKTGDGWRITVIATVFVAPIAALMLLLALQWLEARLLPSGDERPQSGETRRHAERPGGSRPVPRHGSPPAG
jgi:hypothetical protein